MRFLFCFFLCCYDLVELDKEIEDAQMEVDMVSPFIGGARIDHIIAAQEKAEQKAQASDELQQSAFVHPSMNCELHVVRQL